jgi:hypothetical protein
MSEEDVPTKLMMPHTQLAKLFQIANGLEPDLIAHAIEGDHAGTTVTAN